MANNRLLKETTGELEELLEIVRSLEEWKTDEAGDRDQADKEILKKVDANTDAITSLE